MTERINKYLASCGICSRRTAEGLVQAGKVSVNGVIIKDLSYKIEKNDTVELEGKKVFPVKDKRVIVLNKPSGILVSHKDRFHEKTVFSLLPDEFANFNYAGRLDMNSRGLMIFTRDGDLINRLTHPSGNLEKEYIVTLERLPDAGMLKEIKQGVPMDDEILQAKKIVIIDAEKNKVSIVLNEGKKRHIRRMFSYFGIKVIDLVRIRIGQLKLEKLGLKEGAWILIEPRDIY